jgi:hypothetical protein
MRTRLFVFAVLVLTLTSVAMAADDPFVGTWKLDLGKTKVPPGQEMKSYVMKWEKHGSGYKNTADAIGATGAAFHVEFTVQEEGVDYPMTGNPIANTVSYNKIDAGTVGAMLKRTGTVVARMRSSVSADGKTLTIIQTIVGANGSETASTLIFEKQ